MSNGAPPMLSTLPPLARNSSMTLVFQSLTMASSLSSSGLPPYAASAARLIAASVSGMPVFAFS